jgi:hypothetical protein
MPMVAACGLVRDPARTIIKACWKIHEPGIGVARQPARCGARRAA